MITLSNVKPNHVAWSGFARKVILLSLFLVIMASPMLAQVPLTSNITVKGKVTSSEDGQPLPGASIYLKGSQHGTTSDADGRFEFPKKLIVGDVLVFSYIGYVTQEIMVEDQMADLNVVMVFDSIAAFGDLSDNEPFVAAQHRGIRKLFRKAKSGI